MNGLNKKGHWEEWPKRLILTDVLPSYSTRQFITTTFFHEVKYG
jgi:hypothetical protein